MPPTETSRAVVVERAGAAPVLMELPLPQLDRGTALVAVSAATLCGTDVHLWRGELSDGVEFPYVLGHESAGTILRMGGPRHDVTGTPVVEGDRVIWTYDFCGRCYSCCVADQPNLCADAVRYGRSSAARAPYLLGGCAEYQFVPAGASLIRVPEEVSFPLAASASCALRTVMHAFELLNRLKPFESVLVQGCGPVGLYSVAVARALGAGTILIAGAPKQRLAFAGRLGADSSYAIDDASTGMTQADWVANSTEGRGVDVVLQCATVSALPDAFSCVRRGGRIVSIGGGKAVAEISGDLLSKGVTLFSVRSAVARHYYQALRFLQSRQGTVLQEMFSRSYPLTEAGVALQRLEDLQDIKPLILPQPAEGELHPSSPGRES